ALQETDGGRGRPPQQGPPQVVRRTPACRHPALVGVTSRVIVGGCRGSVDGSRTPSTPRSRLRGPRVSTPRNLRFRGDPGPGPAHTERLRILRRGPGGGGRGRLE